MTLTLGELLQQNPVLTILAIVIVIIVLLKIVRGKQPKKTGEKTEAEIHAKPAAVPAAPGGDIIAAITAAVSEHRKKAN